MNKLYGFLLVTTLTFSCNIDKTHHDCEDESVTELNKLPGGSNYFPYESLAVAQTLILENSKRFLSLLNVRVMNLELEDIDYYPRPSPNRHMIDVRKKDLIALIVDHKQMGVGGDTSWGRRVHDEYTIPAKPYSYGFTIRPINSRTENILALAKRNNKPNIKTK